MPTAVQTPPLAEPARPQGRRRYRKQVLPVGTVDHPTKGTLRFDRPLLQELARNFAARALDVVPFTLADAQNRHTSEPEHFRGEVLSLEVTSDGLYTVIETTARGAQLLEDNPKLPVSARIARRAFGKFKGRPVLEHVCATLDPVATGMRAWQPVDLSHGRERVDVLDLSRGSWSADGERRRLAEAVAAGYLGTSADLSAGPQTVVESTDPSDPWAFGSYEDVLRRALWAREAGQAGRIL